MLGSRCVWADVWNVCLFWVLDFITIIDGCPESDGLMVTRKVGVSFSFVRFDGRSVAGTVGSWGLIDFIFLISRELPISYNMNFKFNTNHIHPTFIIWIHISDSIRFSIYTYTCRYYGFCRATGWLIVNCNYKVDDHVHHRTNEISQKYKNKNSSKTTEWSIIEKSQHHV